MKSKKKKDSIADTPLILAAKECPSAFGPLYERFARNAVIDSQRRKRPALPWAFAEKAIAADETQDPERAAVQDEDLRQLNKMIAALDAEKRDLLALRFGAELSCKEIAQVVGKSEAAVKKQLVRTLRLLREKRYVS